MSLITLENVSKSFVGTGQVVSSLNLSVPRGQFLALLGSSGCGKSTLLKMIAGLEVSDTGRISGLSELKTSFVFQEASLLPWRTALENVHLPLELDTQGLRELNIERAKEALVSVGLKDAFDRRPHQLSGGMKMRVSLARALVTNPEILFLDEPFSALDELTRFRLQEDLLRFWKNSARPMTVIFVTHSISEAAFLAERQVVFSRRPARIIADRVSSLGSPREIARQEQTRHSPEFSEDVRTLQSLFRETDESALARIP